MLDKGTQSTPSSSQSSQTTGQNTGSTAGVDPKQSTTSAPEWHQHIPEDLRGEKTWEKYKDLPSALKSLHHAEKKIGSTLQVPTDKSTPEEIAAFREKLGVPKDPKEYKVDEVKLPGEGKWDEAGIGIFNDVAHKLGLTPAQHKGLLEYYSGQLGKLHESGDAAYAEAEKTLKEEWGTKYDANLASVGAGLAAHDPKGEVKDLLKSAGLDNHPAILRFMHSIGSEVGEDKIINGEKPEAMTKEDAEKKLKEIRNTPDHPLFDKKHVGHKDAVKDYEELLKLTV
jgi:hypothetical protein